MQKRHSKILKRALRIHKRVFKMYKRQSQILKSASKIQNRAFRIFKDRVDLIMGYMLRKFDKKINCPAANFALLQWRVVDVIERCSLKTLIRRTRQTSSDKSATASNAGR